LIPAAGINGVDDGEYFYFIALSKQNVNVTRKRIAEILILVESLILSIIHRLIPSMCYAPS
jgi:hypothetical protein